MDFPILGTLSAIDRARIALTSQGPFFLSGEDALQLSVINSLAGGQTVTIVGRMMLLDGTMRTFSETITPSAARTLQSIQRSLGEGWLLNFSVSASAATTLIGMTWARVQVLRGQTGATSLVASLMAGYVTSSQPIAWPGSPIESSLEGQGNIRSITGTNPAAGVEISETVPTGARWKLLAFSASFVTDATVANRGPVFFVDDGVTVLFATDPNILQTASLSPRYNAFPGGPRLSAVQSNSQWSLPVDLRLLAGYRLRTSTGNLQAGDDWTAPQMLVEEWLEAP